MTQNDSRKILLKQFLLKNKPQGKLLTLYNWGGWLIWNYPEIKPSIDGRMHLWKDEKDYSAFNEYFPFEQNQQDINIAGYQVVLMSPTKAMYVRLKQLVREGKWKLLYEDDVSGIFQKL